MATLTTGLMTFEEFECLPEFAGKQELLNGELIELPPPKQRHNQIIKRLYHLLLDAVERPGNLQAGEVGIEWGYRITGSWLIPDVSVTHPGQAQEDYYEGAPLLAVEVVSRANSADQITAKVKLYLANGAREVWVLHPNVGIALVHFETGAARFETTLTSELFPGLSIDLVALFA